MIRFNQYFNLREAETAGDYLQTDDTPDLPQDGDPAMGFGKKEEPNELFEAAREAAQKLQDALHKLQPLVPQEHPSADIDALIHQAEAIGNNLEAMADKMNPHPEDEEGQLDAEPEQTNQSIN